jgi:hypothetical protein
MKKDPDPKWVEMGTAFASFHPERKKVDSSEWRVPWFMLIELLRKLGILKVDPVPVGAEGSAPEPQEERGEKTTKIQEDLHLQVSDKGKNVARCSTSNEGETSNMEESTSDCVEVKSEKATSEPAPESGVRFKWWLKKKNEGSKEESRDPEKGGQM